MSDETEKIADFLDGVRNLFHTDQEVRTAYLEHIPSLLSQLAQARQQIEFLQRSIGSLQRGFVNIYHFIEGKDCEPLVGIGMATSAVDRLKKRAESTDQQLAEARAHCAHCICECPECKKAEAEKEQRLATLACNEAFDKAVEQASEHISPYCHKHISPGRSGICWRKYGHEGECRQYLDEP